MNIDNGYFDLDEIKKIGFKSVGENVKVSRNSTIIGVDNISIGDDTRIDDFCILIAPDEGYIKIGSNVHIAAFCLLSGGDGIELGDFSGLSHGVKVYSKTDDYSGMSLTNPTVPTEYTNVIGGKVEISRHVIVGSGTVILPKVSIGEGSSIGAQSLVTKSLDEWFVYFGCPVKKLKPRKKKLLELERKYLTQKNGGDK